MEKKETPSQEEVIQKLLTVLLVHVLSESRPSFDDALSKIKHLQGAKTILERTLTELDKNLGSAVTEAVASVKKHSQYKRLRLTVGKNNPQLAKKVELLFSSFLEGVKTPEDAINLLRDGGCSEEQAKRVIQKGLSFCKSRKACIRYQRSLKHLHFSQYGDEVLEKALRFSYDAESCFYIFDRAHDEAVRESALARALQCLTDSYNKKFEILLRIYKSTKKSEIKKLAQEKFLEFSRIKRRIIRKEKNFSTIIYFYRITLEMEVDIEEMREILAEYVSYLTQAEGKSVGFLLEELKKIPNTIKGWSALAWRILEKAENSEQVLGIKNMSRRFPKIQRKCDEYLLRF